GPCSPPSVFAWLRNDVKDTGSGPFPHRRGRLFFLGACTQCRGGGKLGIDVANTDRTQTAAGTLAILLPVHYVRPSADVDVLATAHVATSESAMGECVSKAEKLAEQLDATDLGDL